MLVSATDGSPEWTSMCLSRELCELSTLPQIVHALDVVASVTRLCDRMCLVRSWLLGNSSSHTGHVNVSWPSSPAMGNIYTFHTEHASSLPISKESLTR